MSAPMLLFQWGGSSWMETSQTWGLLPPLLIFQQIVSAKEKEYSAKERTAGVS